jgi:hypothetical protein
MTTIRYGVPGLARVELVIFNVRGQRVRMLVPLGVQERGWHSVDWDGRDDRGVEVATGAYFCRLRVGSQILTRKLVLLR